MCVNKWWNFYWPFGIVFGRILIVFSVDLSAFCVCGFLIFAEFHVAPNNNNGKTGIQWIFIFAFGSIQHWIVIKAKSTQNRNKIKANNALNCECKCECECVCSVVVSVVQIRIWLYILAAIFINTHTCVSSSCGLYVPFSSSVCTADAIFNNISMTILFRPKKGRCIHKNIAPKRWNCINGLSFVKYWNWYWSIEVGYS